MAHKTKHIKRRIYIFLILLTILMTSFSTSIPASAKTRSSRSYGMISESPSAEKVWIESRYLKITFEQSSAKMIRHRQNYDEYLLMIGPYSYKMFLIRGNVYINMYPTGEAGRYLPARGYIPIEYPEVAGKYYRKKEDLYFYGWIMKHWSFQINRRYTGHIFQTLSNQGVSVRVKKKENGFKEMVVRPIY